MGIFLEPGGAGRCDLVHLLHVLGHITVTRHTEKARRKLGSYSEYEIDDQEVKTVLRSTEYGGDGDGAWVLLEPTEPAAAEL